MMNSLECGEQKRLVAVVTPVVRLPPSVEEASAQISGQFDRDIIGPQSLPKEFSNFALCRFPAHCSTDRYAYNCLLLTEQFYWALANYEYILIYQLDCLVFESHAHAFDLPIFVNRFGVSSGPGQSGKTDQEKARGNESKI
jgi:hypothetical protein